MKHVASNILKTNYKSTFLSHAKDQETIWRKLLVESRPYSDMLKKLLIINASNCLDRTQEQYQRTIEQYNIKRMMDEQYIKSVSFLSASMKKLSLTLCLNLMILLLLTILVIAIASLA